MLFKMYHLFHQSSKQRPEALGFRDMRDVTLPIGMVVLSETFYDFGYNHIATLSVSSDFTTGTVRPANIH